MMRFALVACLAACSSAPPKPAQTLPTAMREFNEALHWKHMGVAAGYFCGKDSADQLEKTQTVIEEIEIVDFEVLRVEASSDANSAECTVRVSWYTKDDPTVRKGTEIQQWLRVDGLWRFAGRLPPEKPASCSPFVHCAATPKNSR